MIRLRYISDEDMTGAKGSGRFHWYAETDGFDGVGSTPLDAVMALADQMAEYIASSENVEEPT